MSRKNENPYTIQELLGEEFEPMDRRELGAIDSAHETGFGVYEGVDVVAKPFYGAASHHRATKEAYLEQTIASHGIRTVEPIKVVTPRQANTAVLLTKYIPGMLGANTLTLEADPDSQKGAALAQPLGAIAMSLGRLHGFRITHGDPQIKNYGFLAKEIAEGITDDPYVWDLESGSKHGTKGRATELLGQSAKNDLGKLGRSLGRKQLGGSDSERAEDVLRDLVLRPYESSPATEVITGPDVAKAIDKAVAEFIRGRETSLRHYGDMSKVS